MKRNIEIINDNIDFNDLIDKIKAFGYSKITVMYDEINYLFFDYPYVDNNMRNVLTIEDFSGNLLYLKGYNSGYGGTGPNKTRALLTALGISDEFAEELMYLNGFQITFDNDGRCQHWVTDKGLPFENRKHELNSESIFVDYDRMSANLPKRQLYFIEPSKESYVSLLQTLDCIDIDKMDYYIGEENQRYFDFDLPQWQGQYREIGPYSSRIKRVLNGPFIRFSGYPFDVICLLGDDAPASYINTLSMYLRDKPVFYEKERTSKQLLLDSSYRRNYTGTKLDKLLNILVFFRKQGDIFDSVKISKKAVFERTVFLRKDLEEERMLVND